MRVSCTTLESFRLFCLPDQEWLSEADLIATICGRFTPTPEIQLGAAWGRILEQPWRFQVPGGYRVPVQSTQPWDRPVFVPDLVMREALAYCDHAHGVFEAKAVQRYGPIDVVSKCDQLLGNTIIEFKTRTSTFDPDKYLESCQWRFMLDAFEVPRACYVVFEIHVPRRQDVFTEVDGHWQPSLDEVHVMPVYRYPALARDCQDLVLEFDAFVRARGLLRLLAQRQAAAVNNFEWVA